ncbi:MAG: hypothetical protein RMY29_030145 [Nostoc sp. CreGUA01]|nr:hypothetical protein [Nostoc sp. CreGUA01]
MNKIAFYGTIYSGDYKVVAAILKNWLKTEDLDIKIRLSGEEIVYETEEFYLYSYNSVTVEGVPPSFLLEGNMSGKLEEVKALLQQLWQLCQEQNITSSFEYVEVTEDGDEVSEQFYIE